MSSPNRGGVFINQSRMPVRRRSPFLALLALSIALLTGFGLYVHQNETAHDRSRKPRIVHIRSKKLAQPRSKHKASGLAEPSARSPLTILSVGDSLGEDLGYGLQDIIGSEPHIHLILDAVGSTGLANVAYYNWPKTLALELKQTHPQIMVILIGGNDAVGFDQGNQPVPFGTALWHHYYSLRVAKMMSEAVRAGCRVFWVGLPIMAKDSVLSNHAMQELNRVYRTEAKSHPGVTYVSSWKLFQNTSGHFTEYLKNPSGLNTIVRDSDGVHIAPPAGQELVASAVLSAIDRVEDLHICAEPGDYWPEFNPKGCPMAINSGS